MCQVTGRKFQKVLQDVPADSLELTIKEGKGKWQGKTTWLRCCPYRYH